MFKEHKYSSWQKAREQLAKNFSAQWAFRGVANSEWHLESSIEKAWVGPGRDEAERILISLYDRKARSLRLDRPAPKDRLGLLAEMQHFGAPTRLLDWTKSFYVAAFFAFQNPPPPGSVWVSIWAIDLGWCKSEAIDKIKALGPVYANLTVRDDIGGKALFEPVVLQNKSDFVAPLVSYDVNERLGIQQGIFLCAGNVAKSFEDNLAVFPVDEVAKRCLKYSIPAKYRREVLDELRSMNISTATLFPGLEGFARSLNNELLILSKRPDILNKVKEHPEDNLIYL
jgi:hypothetical protein